MVKELKINFKKNKKLRMFFIFLVLSIIFWTLSKLSKEYIHTVAFNVKYINATNDKLLQNKPVDKLSVALKTSGFKLLGYNINSSNLKIDLKKIEQKAGKFYYETNKHLSEFQTQLSSEETIIKINPDTLFFDFGKLKHKVINVIPVININYKPGYNLLDKIEVLPKTITITGAERQIDSMQSIHTELLELNNISSKFKKKIKLAIPKSLDKIHFSETEIEVIGRVKKFTEGKTEVVFEIKNLPEGFNISTFSKTIALTYKVSLENFNKIHASDFKIVCDYKKTQKENLNYLVPVVIKKSNLVSDVKITPKKIEFLIKR